MPHHLVLPRLDAASVTTGQVRVVRGRQWSAEQGSEPRPIVYPSPSGDQIPRGRTGIPTTPAARIACFNSTTWRAPTDNPTTGFRDRSKTIAYLVAVTFVTYSALTAAGAIRARIGRPKSAIDLFPGMVNWLYAGPRPKSVKESPVIAKAAEDVDWETGLFQGQRGLNRDLQGSAGCRRRIAVR